MKSGEYFLRKGDPNKLIDIGVGRLSLVHNSATFWIREQCVSEISRPLIESAASNHMELSGMEPCGVDRRGAVKYKSARWFLFYEEPK